MHRGAFVLTPAMEAASLGAPGGRRRDFLRILVARGLRILLDFAGICRVKSFIFCACNGRFRSHNPYLVGSSPTAATNQISLPAKLGGLRRACVWLRFAGFRKIRGAK